MSASEPAKKERVDERAFDTARELVDALDISREHWTNARTPACPWVFRGQADASWGLIAPAWRKRQREESAPIARMRAKLAPYGKPPTPLRDADRERYVFGQALAEIAVVSAFVALTDDLGISVPDSDCVPLPFDVTNREWLLRARELAQPYVHDASSNTWQPKETSFAANGAFALAQHHGIPTRLLDWSRDPLVAAYFAAEEVRDDRGALAVWAIHRQAVERCRALTVRHVPRSNNAYLHAQSGLFLLHRFGDALHLERGEWPDLLQPLLALDATDDQASIRKYTLPKAQAPELSRILWKRRISRAHMMPTYDSVTAALQRQWELMDL